LKNKKVTYNPKGIKRIENITPKSPVPTRDLNLTNILIKNDKDHYWRIEKKA